MFSRKKSILFPILSFLSVIAVSGTQTANVVSNSSYLVLQFYKKHISPSKLQFLFPMLHAPSVTCVSVVCFSLLLE